MAVKHTNNGPFTTLAEGQTAWEASHTVENATITDAMLASSFQPLDADLTALAGLTSAANKGIQFTGVATAGTYDLTTAGKALLDDTDAAAQRTTLGLGTLATQSGTFSGTSSGTNTGDQTGGTPAIVLGTANTAGTSPNFLRRDDTILAFDATVPAAVGTAAAGAATTAARRDHVHNTGASTPTTAASGDVAAVGTGPASAMTDHRHGMPTFPTAFVLPTVVAVGTSATSAGSNITPGLPTGHTTNDILLLFCQTSQQALTAPAGYVQLGPAFGIGTAAAALSTRGYVFWKRDGGSESAPTVTGAADHTLGQIMAVRGCITTGSPFLNVGTARKVVASTTGTSVAGDTPVDACLAVICFVHGLDSASAVFSGWTNSDLTNVTEQIDVATADGNGGGIGVATGGQTNAGRFTNTTVTETSTTDTSVVFVMLPAGITQRAGFIDSQTFLTPTLVDTWTKPTGANVVNISGIGSGASGSGGRNAATAAGGGGGGGGLFQRLVMGAPELPATLTVTPGAGGAATANSDGATSNVGVASTVIASAVTILSASGGAAAGASATGAGGLGGNGGGRATALAAGTTSYTDQPPGGGTGGTTGGPGGIAIGNCGGAGSGGGTTQSGSPGGAGFYGAGGGGGGRSNTNVSAGGAGIMTSGLAGGATAGANGADSPYPDQYGGSGAASGTSAAGPGGQGGWPGGGGGGGGSQSGAQRGGAGGDGVVVITTFC